MKLFAKTGIARLWIILLVAGLSMVSVTAVSSAVTVGENYGGGIVFYVDKTGEHGLIASRADMAGHSENYPEGYFKWEEAKAECSDLNENGLYRLVLAKQKRTEQTLSQKKYCWWFFGRYLLEFYSKQCLYRMASGFS